MEQRNRKEKRRRSVAPHSRAVLPALAGDAGATARPQSGDDRRLPVSLDRLMPVDRLNPAGPFVGPRYRHGHTQRSGERRTLGAIAPPAALAVSTMRLTHNVLRSSMRQATRWKLIPVDPTRDVGAPPVPRQRPRAFSLDQAMKTPRYSRGRPGALCRSWRCCSASGLRTLRRCSVRRRCRRSHARRGRDQARHDRGHHQPVLQERRRSTSSARVRAVYKRQSARPATERSCT